MLCLLRAIIEIIEIIAIIEIIEIIEMIEIMDDNFDFVCVSLAFKILYKTRSLFNAFSPQKGGLSEMMMMMMMMMMNITIPF